MIQAAKTKQQLTEEQIHMVKAAAKRPVARDDDNPELTDEQLASLRKMQEIIIYYAALRLR